MPDRRRVGRRLAAVMASVVLTLLLASPGMTTAAPETTPGTTAPDTTPAARFATITIDSMTPSIVTSTSTPRVVLTGQVRNTGDRTIHDLTIRLERGDAVTSAAGLRTSLTEEHPPVAIAAPFRELTAELAPGAQVGFRIDLPLSGADRSGTPGLEISRPGVYPVQVNVNGIPDYGSTAQVAGSRTLLPVLSLPPDATRADGYEGTDAERTGDGIPGLGRDGSVSPNLSSPARMTLLYPLAAPPQLSPGIPGGNTQPVRLANENMARSLSPGGRLHNLLTALDGADSSSSTKVTEGLCLAIDPDLLVTVRAMSLGYEVSDDPGNPESGTYDGTGVDAAGDWLSTLRRIAANLCVVALPFAQADLNSLAQIDSPGLSMAALTAPADVVDAILGVRSVRNLTIPALGAIDDAGAKVLTDSRVTSVALTAGSVDPTRSPSPSGMYQVGALGVQTYDAPITAAFGGLGTAPSTPAITPVGQRVDLSAESPLSRRQAALAAMAYPAIAAPPADSGRREPTSTPDSPRVGRSELLMPPTYWSPTTDDASALFTTARLLLSSGAAVATPLSTLVNELPGASTSARFVRPPGVTSLERTGSVLDPVTTRAIADATEVSWQLQGSLVRSADVAATPERYLSPLREDLLRAIRSPDQAGAAVRAELTAEQRTRVRAVGSTLGRMRSQVTILDPGARYTLASERSPILLVVRNGLELPVRVKITAAAPAELDIGDLGVIEIPANGTRQIQLPTHANSSEALTVKITLTTTTGLSLGEPIALSLRSNAYGKPLFIITIIAAAALVLLTARRLWHRFRGQPDPADADRPEPDELERLLAGSSYQTRRRTLQHEETDSDEYGDPQAVHHNGEAGPRSDRTEREQGQQE